MFSEEVVKVVLKRIKADCVILSQESIRGEKSRKSVAQEEAQRVYFFLRDDGWKSESVDMGWIFTR